MAKFNVILDRKLADYADGLDLIASRYDMEYTISDTADASAINVGGAEFAAGIKEFDEFVADIEPANRWHVVFKTDKGGMVVCGDRKIDVMHGLLKAFDRIDEDIREYNVSRYNRFYENFDDFYSGFARAADDFDLVIHLIDTVRAGVESFEINTLYDDIPIQIREREHQNDVYPWWCTYSPGLDMFYESNLNKGTYKASMLEKNRKRLIKNATLAKAFGLAPVFTTFEPRLIPERLFRKYPEIRGARVDYDAYSAVPEFGLDPTHPLVLDHFAEMMEQLMNDVGELALYEIWSQDSNASFPWADCSYMKRNGPLRLFNKEFHEIVNPLLIRLRDVVAKHNPNTKINLNLDWVFSDREKEDIALHLPENVGLTFTFDMLSRGNLPYEGKLRELGDENMQYITNGIGHDWKMYAPLVGFPFPRRTYRHLCEVLSKGAHNFTLRGGLCTKAFVPDYINNEIIREVKYRDIDDMDAFLMKQAKRLTKSDAEATALCKAWDLCDEFDKEYRASRRINDEDVYIHWTCSLFVSPRTLFRKLVWPVVPNLVDLEFSETRYYKPAMFFTYETDPSWVDMTCFNFSQQTSDRMLEFAYKRCEDVLLPMLKKIISILAGIGDAGEYVVDVRDRIECFMHIISTEKSLMKVQLYTHFYDKEPSEAKKAEYKKIIRHEMVDEMENVGEFIKLLEESKSVLIPTTSGEETVYMYKSPMEQHLKRKLVVMKNHIDDEPRGIINELNY